jgi:haloacetate dehalogenase
MRRHSVRANGIRLNTWTGGDGPALVLLHGYPQTAQMWRKMTPALVKQFSVVCPDLRGYGDSDKPRDGFDKRSMARDIAELMRELGHDRYMVVGHDRGARVAHRLALDHGDAVSRLAVLDIVPTHTVFRDTGKELAAAYWHWFFFQAPDLPEIMIRNSAEPFLRMMFRALTWQQDAIEEPMFQEYLRALLLPGTDLDKKLRCPVYAIWGEFGKMHALFDVVETWREKAVDVRGNPIACGHFIPEEAPEELLSELLPFLHGEK